MRPSDDWGIFKYHIIQTTHESVYVYIYIIYIAIRF